MFFKSIVAGALSALAVALPSTLPLSAQRTIDLPGGDRSLDADFEEIFRVGVVDGESWEMFGYVHEVAFDANGNLYVFDALTSGGALPDGRSFSTPSIEDTRVLVFDASGRFVREFGSRGEGPGEFNRPTGFAVMRDGTTVVNDLGHRAYQLFDANGGFVRMVRAGVDSRTMLVDPRGGGVFKGDFNGTTSLSISSQGGPPPPPPTSRPVVRMDLGGEEVRVDTVVQGWLPPRDAEGIDLADMLELPDDVSDDVAAQLRQALAGRSFADGPVFEPPFLVGVLPDGSVVHSDSSAYALQVTPPDGDEVDRVIRRPLRPRTGHGIGPERVSEEFAKRFRRCAIQCRRSQCLHLLSNRDARAGVLPRILRFARPLHHLGGAHLGEPPGRGVDRARTDRRRHGGRGLRGHLRRRRDHDPRRLRPRRNGRVHREGRGVRSGERRGEKAARGRPVSRGGPDGRRNAASPGYRLGGNRLFTTLL